jgi:DNA mismatch repair protein MutS2
VEVGGKKMTVKRSQLFMVVPPALDAQANNERAHERSTGEPAHRLIAIGHDVEPLRGATIDVRGHDREDALSQVDLFLDRAVLTGLHEVTIIHGVGEEVLLTAVQSHLRGDPRVESIRLGGLGEGGRGVTVVRLR